MGANVRSPLLIAKRLEQRENFNFVRSFYVFYIFLFLQRGFRVAYEEKHK